MNEYKYGEDIELDKLRTEVNMKKVLEGMDKNLKKATCTRCISNKLKGGYHG
jgi:hypothetical protein